MHRTPLGKTALTLCIALVLVVLSATPSAEAQQTFTVDRLIDTGEGEGLTGDLRYCITNATDGDTIAFTVTGTIGLTRALPDLTRSISIEGPGANLLTVQRVTGGYYRIFTVGPGNISVNISGLRIAGGRLSGYSFGGGIYNWATLTLTNSTVERNAAGSAGGGIVNNGILTVTNSTISKNELGTEFTESGAAGGGIYNTGMLTIGNSTVSGNIAAGTPGEKCPSCPGIGGGIYNTGTLTISNSTISGNTAVPYEEGGGIYEDRIAVLNMRNTIMFGNRASTGPDLRGQITVSGHNLIGEARDGSGYDETDLLNVDPMLGPLQDNGGPTFTHALLPGSPAIDAGDNMDVPDFDQRGPGFPRIVNGIIDIGAFEVQAVTGGRSRQ